jgi:hypothetical protein
MREFLIIRFDQESRKYRCSQFELRETGLLEFEHDDTVNNAELMGYIEGFYQSCFRNAGYDESWLKRGAAEVPSTGVYFVNLDEEVAQIIEHERHMLNLRKTPAA